MVRLLLFSQRMRTTVARFASGVATPTLPAVDGVRRTVERRYTTFLDATPDEIFVIDPHGVIEYVNRSAAKRLGLREDDAVGQNMRDLLPAGSLNAHLRHHARVLETRQPVYVEEEVTFNDGQRLWQSVWLVPLEADGGEIRSILGIARDITARKRAEHDLIESRERLKEAEAHLQHDALYDRLTGLCNRALLTDRLSLAQARTARHPDEHHALLLVDLDNFKMVNDSWGHETGDAVLVETAQRLQDCLRAEDTLARLGGDEFVVLTGGVKEPAAVEQVAARIQTTLQRPFMVAGQEAFISCSVGIAVSGRSSDAEEDLLRDADTALCRAKNRGKGGCVVFHSSMRTQTIRRMQLESELRAALQKDQFRVLYQPIVSVKDRRVTGVEALLRWQHPIRGLLTPAQFLNVAEQIGLMIPLGEWVLRTACADAVTWQRGGGLDLIRLAVNLSASEFSDPHFAHRVERVLRESDLDPRALELELSENIIFGSVPSALSDLRQLTRSGVQLSVDDYGAARSSVRWLLTLPVSTLKIDRSFVRQAPVDATSGQVIKALIGLAHNLGLRVVIEGVETEEQEDFVQANEADEMQGFYVSAPLSPDEFRMLLSSDGLDPGDPPIDSTPSSPQR